MVLSKVVAAISFLGNGVSDRKATAPHYIMYYSYCYVLFYCYVCSVLYIPFSSCQLTLFGYPD